MPLTWRGRVRDAERVGHGVSDATRSDAHWNRRGQSVDDAHANAEHDAVAVTSL
jgi:hypothetical protein